MIVRLFGSDGMRVGNSRVIRGTEDLGDLLRRNIGPGKATQPSTPKTLVSSVSNVVVALSLDTL